MIGPSGFVVLPGVLASGDIPLVRRHLEAFAATDDDQRPAGERPDAGTRHLHELDRRIPAVADLVAQPTLAGLVDAVLGPGHRLVQVSERNPRPGFGAQRFHTDGAARPADASPVGVTAIVALCPVDEHNGGTRVIPGSHRRPDLQRRAGALDHHPDELVPRLEPGDALVFDAHLLHSGTRNRSEADRPALQIVWRAAGDTWLG